MTTIEYIAFAKSTPKHFVSMPNGETLQPLAASIRNLVESRIRHSRSFPTRLIPTEDSTIRWLHSIAANPRRMLWGIIDGTTEVGCIGLMVEYDSTPTLDMVCRFHRLPPGIMTHACATVEAVLQTLGEPLVDLRVMGSNDHAIRFYERLGYQFVGADAGEWCQDGDVLRLVTTYKVEDKAAASNDNCLWRMRKLLCNPI